MKELRVPALQEVIYQAKCLINKDNFVRGGACLAFHKCDKNTDAAGCGGYPHRGVFLCKN